MKGNHSSTRIYNQTDIAPHGRSLFDLSHRKLLSCDFGQLIPTLVEEVVPGDYFKIGAQLLVRFQPLVAPIMHEVSVFIHYYFVPYRLLWPKPPYDNPETNESGSWEGFITGGPQGDNDDSIPIWSTAPFTGTVGSLWDYLGYPTGVAVPVGSQPMAFPRRAYNLIFNEYYRDETLIDPVDLDDNTVQYRCWEKDYFTSALPWQQRGEAPALPVTITGSAVFPANNFTDSVSSPQNVQVNGVNTPDKRMATGSSFGRDNLRLLFNDNTLDAEAVTFDVSDLRLVFQIQKFLERNARNGARYTEFLKAHFGVHPHDSRLQRPEYIGGVRSPIIVSEVLQTSSADQQPTPQGNMAGHGITVDNSFAGSYKVEEFGVIMGVLSIMPRSMYQQGIERQWTRRTRYDFYFPEFAGLSEQAIENNEIFTGAVDATNHEIFGYQGRYDELRQRRSIVTGQFRDTFDYWHLGRKFASLPALNQDFVQMNATENTELKRIFAVTSDPGILVSVGNIVTANRPMTAIPVPGFIDH